jgi:hypothetical protein
MLPTPRRRRRIPLVLRRIHPEAPGADVPRDVVTPDVPSADVPAPDAPSTDVPASDAPTDTPTTCTGACCKDTDCPGPCQSCSSSHTCVAASSKDDPSGHCAGTCDATGACKSKLGQACDTVAGGCVSGSTCVDGYCCDSACDGVCEACNVAGSPGKCTTLIANATPHPGHGACVTSNATCAGSCNGNSKDCFYPTTICSQAACVGTTSEQLAVSCSQGVCGNPMTQLCPTNQTCSGSACACSTPMLTCSGACIDPSSDALNCGACSHSCLGGTCAAGQCQAAVVVTTVGLGPEIIGLDDTYVYYGVADPNVAGTYDAYRASKDVTNSSSETFLATSGTFAFTNVMGATLFSRSRHDYSEMCNVTNCSGTLVALPGLAADGEYLPYADFTSPPPTYFAQYDAKTNNNSMTITWYSMSGTPIVVYSDGVPQAGQTGLWTSVRAFGNSVYWIRQLYDSTSTLVDASVYSISTATLTETQLAGSLTSNTTVLVDVNAKSILLLDYPYSKLYRIPLPIGLGSQSPQQLTSLNTSGTYYPAATEDESGAYWVDTDGSLYRCTPSSSTGACTNTKLLASGQANAGILYQNASALYWGNGSKNQIMRLAK